MENDPLNFTDPSGLFADAAHNVGKKGYDLLLAKSVGDIGNLLANPSQIPNALASVAPGIAPALGELPQAVSGAIGALRLLGTPSPNPPNPAPNVQFGSNDNQVYHAFRHTDNVGLDRSAVADAVRTDVQNQATTNPAQRYTGKVTVGSINLEYRGYTLPNGTINVGRITP